MTQPSLSAEQFTRLSQSLPEPLADFLRDKRWFGGKARLIRAIHIEDIVPLAHMTSQTIVAFARVAYEEGQHETYAIPLLTQKSADGNALSTNGELSGLELNVVPLNDALQRPEVLRSFYEAIERKSFFSLMEWRDSSLSNNRIPRNFLACRRFFPAQIDLQRAEQ